MPSLCKIRRSDIIHIPNEGKNADPDRRLSLAGRGSGKSPLRIHPFFGRIAANDRKSDALSINECSDGVCTGGYGRGSTSKSSQREIDEEDKENSKTNVSTIASTSSSNQRKVHNPRKKKRKLTLDAFFIPPLKTDHSDNDEESISENDDVSKKKQRAKKLFSLNEDAKPIHVHIPFLNNEKYVEVRVVSHCVKNRYIVDDEPIVLSGETMYPASSRVAIERFLPGFGRYIH